VCAGNTKCWYLRRHINIVMLLCKKLRGAARKGGTTLLTKRGEGRVASSFDDLAAGLDTGAITRGRAVKLAGAALVASAVGLMGATQADADEVGSLGRRRRRCNQDGGDFCNTTAGNARCSVCCGRGRRRRRACCGSEGCNCCRRGETCRDNGRCV
jgi:hypothetical protein